MTLTVYDAVGNATEFLAGQLDDALIIPPGTELTEPADHAVAYGVIDRVKDPDRYVADLCRTVKPGGRVHLCVRTGPGIEPGRKRNISPVQFAELMRRHGRLIEFAQGDDGMLVGVFTPMRRKGRIAVWCGVGIEQWHPTDIKTKGLGGSETSAWRLACELARFDYDVTLYGHFTGEGAMGDVMLRAAGSFNPMEPRTMIVGLRNARLFDEPTNAGTNLLWLTDVAGPQHDGLSEQNAANIDRIVTLSQWHHDNTLERYPFLDESKLAISRNGIRHEFFDVAPAVREKRVLYTSCPNRGLDIVLECWPMVREQVPDAELVCTYPGYFEKAADMQPGLGPFRDKIHRLVAELEPHGVSYVKGGMSQDHLAQLMLASLVWVHPSYTTTWGGPWFETSCISAMEAQAAGLVVVAGAWGALPETVLSGTLLDGDPQGEEWRARFVEHIVQGLTDPAVQHTAQEIGPREVRDHDWKGPADQLMSMADSRVA